VFGLGIHHFTITPYYPNSSHAESFIRNLKSALIAYHHADHSLWDSELHWLQFAFNSAHHESVKCALISLMFGFAPNNPLYNVWALADLLPNKPDPVALRETWNRARRNLARAHERVRRFYYRGRRLWGGGGGCGAPVPTPLLCPTQLCCSFPPPRALLSFLTWRLFCFTNRTPLTPWISPRTLLPSFGPRKSVLFYLV
jgi:hypothetical protein